MSQDNLANAVNLSRASVTNIESGRQGVTLETLLAIADALDVDAGSLLPERPSALDSPVPEKLKRGLDTDEEAWVTRIVTSGVTSKAARRG